MRPLIALFALLVGAGFAFAHDSPYQHRHDNANTQANHEHRHHQDGPRYRQIQPQYQQYGPPPRYYDPYYDDDGYYQEPRNRVRVCPDGSKGPCIDFRFK